MVTGLRWRRMPPARPSESWSFIHRSDGNPDAVVTIDGTDDQHKVVIANDAGRHYLDRVDDGTALTTITNRYTQAREAPVALTLNRQQWRLTQLEGEAQAALRGVLDGDENVDLSDLTTSVHAMRQQLDLLDTTLRAL